MTKNSRVTLIFGDGRIYQKDNQLFTNQAFSVSLTECHSKAKGLKVHGKILIWSGEITVELTDLKGKKIDLENTAHPQQ